MAAFLALDANRPALQLMQRMDRAAVPLPRPRPKRLWAERFCWPRLRSGHLLGKAAFSGKC